MNYYVASYGKDSNNGLSEKNALANIKTAWNKCTSNDDIIYIVDKINQREAQQLNYEYVFVWFKQNDLNLNLIGLYPGKSEIVFTNPLNAGRNGFAYSMYGGNHKVYCRNLIITLDCTIGSLWSGFFIQCSGIFDNCVLNTTKSNWVFVNPNYNYFFDNKMICNNCSWINPTYLITETINTTFNNSAFAYNAISKSGLTLSNSMKLLHFDETYKITDNNDLNKTYGVYSGEYAWNPKPPKEYADDLHIPTERAIRTAVNNHSFKWIEPN